MKCCTRIFINPIAACFMWDNLSELHEMRNFTWYEIHCSKMCSEFLPESLLIWMHIFWSVASMAEGNNPLSNRINRMLNQVPCYRQVNHKYRYLWPYRNTLFAKYRFVIEIKVVRPNSSFITALSIIYEGFVSPSNANAWDTCKW